MRSIQPRDRRALLIGAAITGAVVAGTKGAPAYIQAVRFEHATARAAVESLATAREMIGLRQAASDTLEARRARTIAAAPLLTPGRQGAASAASLGARVADLAGRAGLATSTLNHEADTSGAGPLASPRVRIDARGDVSGVLQFLLLLEIDPSLSLVRRVAISQGDPLGAPDRAEELRISVEIEGVALAPVREVQPGRVR